MRGWYGQNDRKEGEGDKEGSESNKDVRGKKDIDESKKE